MNEAYVKAEKENSRIIRAAHQALEQTVIENYSVQVECKMFSEEALQARSEWPARADGNDATWDWAELVNRYRRNHPRRFELCLWHSEDLMALALGKLSDRRLIARLGYLEGRPGGPLGTKRGGRAH